MRFILVCALALAVPACASRSQHGAARAPSLPERLLGVEWVLEDLGGTKIVDRSEATLLFPEPGRVAGNASCNRFIGPVAFDQDSITIGPLATSRRRCKAAIGKSEALYLKALSSAERLVLKGPDLTIYSTGMEKPLRFTRNR